MNEEKKVRQLEDGMLENIAGGATESTKMICDKCGNKVDWLGNYDNGLYYDCYRCHGQKTVHSANMPFNPALCKDCFTLLIEGAKFCYMCGTPIEN